MFTPGIGNPEPFFNNSPKSEPLKPKRRETEKDY
jgi:hypothetical protein